MHMNTASDICIELGAKLSMEFCNGVSSKTRKIGPADRHICTGIHQGN